MEQLLSSYPERETAVRQLARKFMQYSFPFLQLAIKILYLNKNNCPAVAIYCANYMKLDIDYTKFPGCVPLQAKKKRNAIEIQLSFFSKVAQVLGNITSGWCSMKRRGENNVKLHFAFLLK